MGSALEATVTLPFEPDYIDEGNDCYNNVESCALYRMLPANARDYVKASPHLLEYLHILPVNTVGIPLFLSELKRDLKSMENPNVIYPVNDSTFVHIFPDQNDVRNWYIPIEPSFLHSVKAILPVIEERLIDMIDALDEEPVTEPARIEVLKNFIRQLVYVQEPNEKIDPSLLSGGAKDLKSRIKTFLTSEVGASANPQASGHPQLADGRLILSQQEYKALEYLMIRDKIEMGTLKPFLSDQYIEDITCDGVGPIFIEHKIFKGLKSVVGFQDSKELDAFVIKLAERIKRPLTYRNPIVDATLPDGSRINIVYGTEISKHGSNFTIRKVNEVPLSILQVIESGACNYMMAAYLWICLEYGMSMFVSGETASGKTTTLNALTTFLPPENKIVTIEDTPELTVPHRNWTREVAKAKGKGEGEGSEITMFDLLKAALRQRPNQILVGEIRGVEGSVAFSAMQTGHPVMSTFHAASVEKLIQRLCGDPINIPKTYVDNLNLVIIQSAVKLPQGGTVRRMLSVNELVGYDPETQGFSFMAAFVWDPATDSFTFTGRGSSYLLENKIATMLGIPENRRADIYDEVDKRAKILERLHKAGYTQFWDLFHMTTKIKKQGLLTIEV
ncbi:type II/IV secretion system ATPase subunit [Methanoculleus sp.]|uniref:type II/IV secretion system ATPase subunit n=1 Tax=Methanoculleus sp. TaxID=90427 RepID=UPI0025E69FCA|nr:type II/IV secretion system ATPase subunit [Methanoculleus sp.]MCK9319524.1 type II/IV secretion system ATPase subunit [Methanoculleus sp.]MDD2255294.1 type II/IV secretion system ATPase subunit [Methanoculleus sp.]MDD2788430.1 type II/IV secretion system ATPase subunit [Methanoculleus sp.]MDD3217454.1 type II/IV secretion system ATPase subunit [Methanoculleus sp.]